VKYEDDSQENELLNTNTMLLGDVTIIYILSGKTKVSVDGGKTSNILAVGGTLICEREGQEPIDVLMTPIAIPGEPLHSDQTDAKVLIIQVNYIKKKEGVASPLFVASDTSLMPRSRRNSSINFHDQPSTWNLDPSKILMRKDSAGMPPLPGSLSSANLTTKFFESAQHYIPPVFDRGDNESEVPPPVIRDCLVVDEFPKGTISTAWINMVKQGLSEWIRVPVIIARGVEPGPVVSLAILKIIRLESQQLCMEMNLMESLASTES
jgi:hypothetical protein